VLNNDGTLQYVRRVCTAEPSPLTAANYFTKFENHLQYCLITMARMVSRLVTATHYRVLRSGGTSLALLFLKKCKHSVVCCPFITLPAGAVAKYCDEYVCLCVCLFVCPQGYLWNQTSDLYPIFCMLPMPMARSSSSMLMIGRIGYRREGVTGVHSVGEV